MQVMLDDKEENLSQEMDIENISVARKKSLQSMS